MTTVAEVAQLVFEEAMSVGEDFKRMARESADGPEAERAAYLPRLETMHRQYLELMRMHEEAIKAMALRPSG